MPDSPHVVDVRLWPEQPDAYSHMPLHAQVRAVIEGHLERDGYQVGDQLPGEEQGIGTTIIRESVPAWSLMVDPRRGFAAPVHEDLREDTTVEVTRRSLQVAGPEAAEVLATDQALAIDRVLRVAGLPVGSCCTLLPQNGFEELLTAPLSADSISQTLLDQYGRIPGSRDVRVRGVRAGRTEAKLFKLPPRAPVLEVLTVGRDDVGGVLWCATTYYNGAEVELELPSLTPLPLPESG